MRLKTTTLRLTAGLLMAGALPPAWSGDWSAAAALGTDLVAKGLSKTGGQPAASLDLGWRSDTGWTLSAGASTLHDRRAVELTLGAGWQRQWDADWLTQLGLVRYDDTRGRQAASGYTEAYATVGWRGQVSLLVALSPDTRMDPSRPDAPANASRLAELALHQRLAGPWALDAGVGHIDFNHLHSYRYGSVGLSWSHGPWQAFISRIESDAGQRGVVAASVAGGRTVFTLTRQLR